MKPGESVASPRSITCAPCGMERLLPASTILSPWTMTTPFVMSAFDLPSKRRAALRAIVAGSAAETERITAKNAESAEIKRRKFFMASNMKFGARMQGGAAVGLDRGERKKWLANGVVNRLRLIPSRPPVKLPINTVPCREER